MAGTGKEISGFAKKVFMILYSREEKGSNLGRKNEGF
jgi:hypothetical protein